MGELATARTVADIVEEYEAKNAVITEEIEAFHEAERRIKMAASIGGMYGGNVFSRDPNIYERDVRKALLVSGWKTIYSRCQIDRLASAKDKANWERTLQDPPPLTFDNAVATFGDYVMRPRWHILRGLAETFSELDPAFKSHSKVKIGVKSLPKRVIIRGVGGYGSYGRDKIRDILNAIAAYRGEIPVDECELQPLEKLCYCSSHKAGEIRFDGSPVKKYVSGQYQDFTPPNRGVWLRKYANGNAHLYFEPAALLDVNRALAEFYGEVLPDAEGEEPAKPGSTAVAKDLQFYPTPEAVIKEVIDEMGLEKRQEWNADRFKQLRVLEPSCGDGRIMHAIKGYGHRVLGFEIHAGRSAQARAAGLPVVTANFLEQPATGDFDLVIMNPPFYGLHWRHHLRHAVKFLKPGGRLACILPATAHYDHEVEKEFGGSWHDLPVASFAESGTNVPTGFLITRRPQ